MCVCARTTWINSRESLTLLWKIDFREQHLQPILSPEQNLQKTAEPAHQQPTLLHNMMIQFIRNATTSVVTGNVALLSDAVHVSRVGAWVAVRKLNMGRKPFAHSVVQAPNDPFTHTSSDNRNTACQRSREVSTPALCTEGLTNLAFLTLSGEGRYTTQKLLEETAAACSNTYIYICIYAYIYGGVHEYWNPIETPKIL